jgi:hypothetical protein
MTIVEHPSYLQPKTPILSVFSFQQMETTNFWCPILDWAECKEEREGFCL